MGNRQDDRSSRMGTPNDGRRGSGGGPDNGGRGVRGREGAPPPPQRGEPGRAFDRNEDMGGSRWSGASGRGGYASPPGRPGEGGYPSRGGGYDPRNEYGRYTHQGGYAGDRGYASDREYANFVYANEGRHEDHDDGGFLSEDTPGHIPNQRWSGGYGADSDRDRERAGFEPAGPPSGRGFTGNDFGALPRWRDRAYGAPADMEPRHFGNVVDRGGRMGYGGGGYGFRGTDMGMGAPDEDRGPHYGKGPKGYKRSDERTRDDVCEAIAHQGHIDASDVEVKVADGIVTLSGTVAHRHEKRQLEHLVEQCRGVHEVRNEVRLERSDAGKDKDKDRPQKQEPQQQKAADTGDGSSNGIANGKTARS